MVKTHVKKSKVDRQTQDFKKAYKINGDPPFKFFLNTKNYFMTFMFLKQDR
jgi:hypothetical protein